mgnify:FL=1
MTQALVDAFVDIREDEVVRLTHELLAGGTEPLAVLDACKQALDVIGERFAAGQAFVPELIMAGEMMAHV